MEPVGLDLDASARKFAFERDRLEAVFSKFCLQRLFVDARHWSAIFRPEFSLAHHIGAKSVFSRYADPNLRFVGVVRGYPQLAKSLSLQNVLFVRRIQPRLWSQQVICGHTWACAWRPTRIPRCCKQTPTSPGYSMIRRIFDAGIASMNGFTEAKGATSSAVFTTASVGTARLKGPTTVLPIFKTPRQKRFSR